MLEVKHECFLDFINSFQYNIVHAHKGIMATKILWAS